MNSASKGCNGTGPFEALLFGQPTWPHVQVRRTWMTVVRMLECLDRKKQPATTLDRTTIDMYSYPVGQAKAKLDSAAKQKRLVHSRQQDAVVSILRTANYLRRCFSPVFDQHGITRQQYNVLRILRGTGLAGLPTLDIAERMIEQAPGITRLLDRLEGKKLVRRERPSDNRRQVLCYITKPGLDLLQELDIPVRNREKQALHRLDESEIEELIRLLALARGEQPSTTHVPAASSQ
jgi:DNA-binding MarR family transcriptional regulator